MSRARIPFPKYLNAKRLIFRWEYDVVLVSVISFIASMLLQVQLSVPLPISLISSLILGYYVLKKYERYFKKTRKNAFTHYKYSKGFSEPFDKRLITQKFENNLIPKGFEKEFLD